MVKKHVQHQHKNCKHSLSSRDLQGECQFCKNLHKLPVKHDSIVIFDQQTFSIFLACICTKEDKTSVNRNVMAALKLHDYSLANSIRCV